MTYRLLPNWLRPDEQAFLMAAAERLQFEPGRQGTGYLRAAVPLLGARDSARFAALFARSRLSLSAACGLDAEFRQPLTADCWLIRYPVGSSIPLHTDPAWPRSEHWRLNAVVVTGYGGNLVLGGSRVSALGSGDAYAFRPDLVAHEVTQILESERLVWSVGVMLPEQSF